MSNNAFPEDGSKAKPPSKSKMQSESGRVLFSWPISLVGLTVGLLLIANVLSACGGRRDHHDLAEVKEHASDAVAHMLRKLDATEDQEERIQVIVGDAIDELALAHGPRGEGREEFSALLTAETIDREALEAMRRRHLDRADQMSAVATEHLGEVLEVLTPEQRQQLKERMLKHHKRRGWM